MYELFEHKADVGVRGSGKSLNEAFAECARAMFSVMVGLDEVEPKQKIKVNVKARNKEELLLEWLNELLYQSSSKEMVFSEFKPEIEEVKGEFELKGFIFGELAEQEKHDFRTEVKGATFSGLKVIEEQGKFTAECIVDV